MRYLKPHFSGAAKAGLIGAIGLALAACASAPVTNGDDAQAEMRAVNDPLEPVNRVVFEFNRGLDTLFIKPAATFYSAMMPPPIQEAVHNFLGNLKEPVVFLNDILQGEGDRAFNTLNRFVINSTIGVAGLGDPATDLGFPSHSEDFGQTLGVYGMGEGPYLVLPVLGPSNPRDTVGIAVDWLTDPVGNWAQNTDRRWVGPTRMATTAVDFRALNMEEIDDTERTSLDYYATVRSLYRQYRRSEIMNGELPPASYPDISMDDMMDPDAEAPAQATAQ